MRPITRTLTLLITVLAFTRIGDVRPAAQTAPAVTIDALMAAPFPTDLVAAPTGGGLAWVSSASGVNNVWVAEGPDYRARAVTSYTADDGLWITGLTWTGDGKQLVYVRGDGANRQGESPNSRSCRMAPTRRSSRWTWRAGRRAASAPAAVRRRQRGGRALRGCLAEEIPGVSTPAGSDKPAQLVTARGSASMLAWSPDGSMLAFASNRGTHSYIGVFTRRA